MTAEQIAALKADPTKLDAYLMSLKDTPESETPKIDTPPPNGTVEYAKYQALLDEMKKKDAKLQALAAEETKKAEAARLAAEEEAKKKGEYEKLYTDTKAQHDAALKKLEAYEAQIESERQELLKKLPKDKQETFKDLNKQQLSVLVAEFEKPEGDPSSPGQKGGQRNGVPTTLIGMSVEAQAALYNSDPQLFMKLDKQDKAAGWIS